MNISKTKIVFHSAFNEYSIIDDRHYKSLLKPYHNKMIPTVLFDWLGITDKDTQITDDLIYRENIAKQQDKTYENEVNEEEEEEQRRRDEIDTEEYNNHYSSSTIQKSETDIINSTNINRLSTFNIHSKEGCQSVRKKQNYTDRTIRFIIQHPTALTDETVKQVNDDVWRLQMPERYDLYRYWLSKYRQHLHDSLHDAREEYNQAVSDLSKHRQEEDYHILKDSLIIAMTTTCAAKYHQVLEKLRKKILLNFNLNDLFLFLESKIVIVEEAAAIFEAHIITALSTKCQHLILIGDHVQLRPNPSVYRLGIKYNLDVSLFERLIKNNFPNVRLNIQVKKSQKNKIIKRMNLIYCSIVCDLKFHVL